MTTELAKTAVRPSATRRRVRAESPVWRDGLTVLLVLTWLYVLVPRLLQTLLSPKTRFGVGEPVAYSSIGIVAEQGLRAVLLLACVVVFARRLDRLPTDRGVTLLVLLVPWTYVFCRNFYADQPFSTADLVFPFVIVAIWTVRPALSRFALIGILNAGTAALSIGLALLFPAKGVFVGATGQTVEADKAILPIGLLVGPFTSSNNLGQILVLGLPFLWLVRRTGWRLILVALTVFAIVWSASRSSLAALAVIVIVAAVLRLTRSRRARAVIPAMTAAVAGLLVVIIPLSTSDPTAFTNRGIIWMTSLDQWRTSPAFGLGTDWYQRAANYSVNPVTTAFHGHNQLVQILVTDGWVGAVLAAAVIGHVVVVAARQGHSAVPAAFVISLLISCTLEVSFGLVDRDFLLASGTLGLAAAVLADRPPGSPESARPRRLPPSRAPRPSPG